MEKITSGLYSFIKEKALRNGIKTGAKLFSSYALGSQLCFVDLNGYLNKVTV